MSHLCKYCYGRGVRTTKRSLFENKYVRTDLACESGRVAPADCKGAVYERKEYESITVERLNVLNESGEEETGKEIGCYVTVSGAAVRLDLGQDTVLSSIIEKEIRRLCEKTVGITITKSTRVLVAGVGNAMISSDSLGPMTAEMISPTRHLMSVDEFKFLECSEVSVIKTAVLGQTGIESSELIKSICEKISPDIVVTVDALAARSVSRLASTIQLSDTGISPGSGIGNARRHIDKKALGVPVISIGVPTVVDSATLIFDTLDEAGIEELDDRIIKTLENSRSFFVTPKDCDFVNQRISKILSNAIGEVFGCKDL